jgi:hypothetical protein
MISLRNGQDKENPSSWIIEIKKPKALHKVTLGRRAGMTDPCSRKATRNQLRFFQSGSVISTG